MTPEVMAQAARQLTEAARGWCRTAWPVFERLKLEWGGRRIADQDDLERSVRELIESFTAPHFARLWEEKGDAVSLGGGPVVIGASISGDCLHWSIEIVLDGLYGAGHLSQIRREAK